MEQQNHSPRQEKAKDGFANGFCADDELLIFATGEKGDNNMIINLLQICNGIVTIDDNDISFIRHTVATIQHTDTGTNFFSRSPRGEGYKGNISWYTLGRGAKAEGFPPQIWAAKVDGKWYLRLPGGGGRGQCSRTGGAWSTTVILASEGQTKALNSAEERTNFPI
jgi:hypothetical protein